MRTVRLHIVGIGVLGALTSNASVSLQPLGLGLEICQTTYFSEVIDYYSVRSCGAFLGGWG